MSIRGVSITVSFDQNSRSFYLPLLGRGKLVQVYEGANLVGTRKRVDVEVEYKDASGKNKTENLVADFSSATSLPYISSQADVVASVIGRVGSRIRDLEQAFRGR